MNTRLCRVWNASFRRNYLECRQIGMSEDSAIAFAEHKAQEDLDRYCDDKLHLRHEYAE